MRTEKPPPPIRPRHFTETDLFRWIQFLVVVALMPVLGYFSWVHIDHEKRLDVIENNRFRAEDGREVWREIARIREQMAAMPSTQFRAKVDRIEDKIDKMTERLARVEALIQSNGRPPTRR